VFTKVYLSNFTSELFVIDRVRKVPYQPVSYRIRDRQNEPIDGWFYVGLSETETFSNFRVRDLPRLEKSRLETDQIFGRDRDSRLFIIAKNGKKSNAIMFLQCLSLHLLLLLSSSSLSSFFSFTSGAN
jgi:hypothetical protein